MRKSINIKKAAEKILGQGHPDVASLAEINTLILEVLLDIREKLCKQNELIRRNGRS